MTSRRLFAAILLIFCAVTRGISLENTETQGLDVFVVVGSSVDLPGVYIDKQTMYDLEKEEQLLVVMTDGHPIVRWPYTHRATFFPSNGSFFLRNLTKHDSGTYRHWVNMSVQSVIKLHVMEQVVQPVLVILYVRRVPGACEVELLCFAEGDGPVNTTILKDGKEVSGNISRSGSFTNLTLHTGHPDTIGRYTCRSSNPVSSKTTPETELQSGPDGFLVVVVTLGIVFRWFFSVVTRFILPLRERCKRRGRDLEDDEEQQAYDTDNGSINSLCEMIGAVTRADFYLAFPWEVLAMFYYWIERVLPVPWCYIMGCVSMCCVACRVAALRVTVLIDLTKVSDVFIVPAFYFHILFSGESGGPCGLDTWGSVLLFLVFGYVILMCALSFCFYKTEMKKKKDDEK